MTGARIVNPAVSCDGKVRFDSPALARAVTTRHSPRKDRPKRDAYRCVHCGGWHVGTDRSRIGAKQARKVREARHGG